jgi:hypothetical protein
MNLSNAKYETPPPPVADLRPYIASIVEGDWLLMFGTQPIASITSEVVDGLMARAAAGGLPVPQLRPC